MQEETRVAFNAYLDQQAALNGVPVANVHGEKAFTVTPSIQQKLIDKQQESNAFLKNVNIVLVDEMEGETLGLGVTGPLASRTNTAGGTKRTTRDPSGLDKAGYKVAQTNSDTHIRYAKLDMWAKFPDFQTRIRNQIVTQQGLDRIMIGWNGESVATTTDRTANPLLEDVNKGWLQYLRENRPAQVISEGTKVDNKIRIGAFGDYKNLDALVWDLKFSLLPSWARGDTELVAILGDQLMHDKYFPVIDQVLDPTEQLAAEVVTSKKQVGGSRAVTVPFFPSNSIFITRLSELSIYEQRGKRRRTIVDRAELDQIETFESSNEGYVIENLDYGLLIENIEISDVDPAP